MTYQYLFGPVPSRRLGMSLGVDLVPHKVCTLNCIYCECGATTNLTLERREYVPCNEVIKELNDYLGCHPAPDYITFSGSGEPTLNSGIADVITYIKNAYPNIKIAVLTNGSLFYDPEVRRSLYSADLVLPSLDAATRKAFIALNRPHHDLDHQRHIDGLISFSKEFKGKIWMEVFILDRPGVIAGLEKAPVDFLEKIKLDWDMPNLEIIAPVSEREDKRSFRDDIENAVLETISRRPCTLNDLSRILNLHANEINKYLSTLETKGRIESHSMDRGVFYQLKRS